MRMCASVCVGRAQSRAGESQAATAAAINAWPARLNSNFASLSAHLIQYSWWVPSLCCCRCRCCCCWHRVIAPWGALWERKKYKLLLYPHFSVTRRDATQRRRRQRRQGRQRWLWQRRSLSKNSSRNRSVCVNMCCVCVCESDIDTCGESDLFTGDSHWHVKRNQMTQIEPNGQLMTIW